MRARERSRVRWKLLLVPILVLCLVLALLLAAAWSVELPQRQSRVVFSMMTVGGASLLLLFWVALWLLAFSGLGRRARLAGLTAYGLLLVILAGSFVPAGWSGDVVPLFRWRWTRSAGDLPVEIPSALAGQRRAMTSAHDWPGFLGPERNGIVRGVTLVREWSRPPRELWRRAVGAGWSGFAIAGDFAVTQEQRGQQELVTAYDLRDGQPIWTHAEPTRFEDSIGGPGPRATPAIDSGRVYAIGGTGRLVAVDLVSGRLVWSRQVLVDHRASAPMYGVAASPLVTGRLVVVAAGGPAGGSLAAYDAATGESVWSGGDAPAAYSSPMWVELSGVPQIVLLGGHGLVAHDPATGRVLWSREWPPVEKISQPVALPPDKLFVSTGYGVGARLFAIERDAADGLAPRLVWESLAMKAKLSNVVAHEGHLYGLDDGILACVDVSDGSRRWKGGRYGHGQVLLVGDLLLVLGERGSVSLVEAAPKGHVEIGSFAALEGKTWNHPALAGNRLVVRNDREAACFELPAQEAD